MFDTKRRRIKFLSMIKKKKKIVTNESLWNRIVFTFSVLLIFRIGHYVKIPFAEMTNVSTGSGFADILNMASTFTGGNFSKACLFTLGVSAYISTSLVISMLKIISKASEGAIFKKFYKWEEEGTYGRVKFERVTRICSVLVSLVYGIGFLSIVPLTDDSLITKILFVAMLVAGSTICIWLGDLITEKGIGNGISILMFAGIVARIPSEFSTAYQMLQSNFTEQKYIFYLIFAGYIVVYLIFLRFICNLEITNRKINLQTSMKSKNEKRHFLPMLLKLNFGGVMPVIFASAIFAWASVGTMFVDAESGFAKFLGYMSYSSWIGLGIYALLIFIFSYFYSKLSFNAEEQAKNLRRNNQVIVGVRPGKDTVKYLSNTIRNISIIAGFALIIIAVVPYMLPLVWSNSAASSLVFGGTSIMIVASVSIESIKQIKSQIKEVHGFMDVANEKTVLK